MKTEIEITVTPDQLAEMFIRWGNDEQARFFNLIGKHFKACDFSAEDQCCWISCEINKDGKDFIFTLANFVKARSVPVDSPQQKHLLNAYEPCDLRG